LWLQLDNCFSVLDFLAGVSLTAPKMELISYCRLNEGFPGLSERLRWSQCCFSHPDADSDCVDRLYFSGAPPPSHHPLLCSAWREDIKSCRQVYDQQGACRMVGRVEEYRSNFDELF